MSNRASKIKRALPPDNLYNTTIGTTIAAIGILTQTPIQKQRQLLSKLRKDAKSLPNTVEGIATLVWDALSQPNSPKSLRKFLVLVYDKNDVRTPLITITDSDGHILPLRRDGFKEVNILSLANEGRDYIEVEYIYDENGEAYND